MGLAWAHERPILEAIVFELPLILFWDAESLQTPLVLELKASLCSAVLHQAEHLDEESRVFDDATVSTDCLVGDVRVAHFTLVLYLDELDIRDESQHFNHMSDDLVGWDCLNQLDLIIGLEISHLVFSLSNNLKVGAAEHELHVDVDGYWNLADSVLHKQDHSTLQVGFKVDAAAMFNEQSDLTLVIGAFQVDMTGYKVGSTVSRTLLQTLVNLHQSQQIG